MAHSAAEQKNGLAAISAIVISVTKKSLVHLIRGSQVDPALGRKVIEYKQILATLTRQSTARACFAAYFSTKASIARSAAGPRRRMKIRSSRQL